MIYVAFILILLFAAYLCRNYWWPLVKAKWDGIETDARVSRIAEYPRRFVYVSFSRQDGVQNEARLLNPKKALMVGDTVRIRYLEEKNDCAVQI